MRDYLLPGNGYTYVDWAGNRIEGLYYVDPLQVSAEVGSDPIYKTARFYIGGASYPDWKIFRVLRNTRDGAFGSGLVAESPTQLETMLNALQYENHMVRTGSKKGFLKAKNRLTQDVITQLKNSWRKLYGNSSEENVVVLNDGIEFQDASQNAVDSQLNENKTTNDHEIYKIFCIVPSVLEGGATEEDLKTQSALRSSRLSRRFRPRSIVTASWRVRKELLHSRSTWMCWTIRICCPGTRLTRWQCGMAGCSWMRSAMKRAGIRWG